MFMVGFLAALGGMFCIAVTQSKQVKLLFGSVPSSGWQRFSMWSGTALLRSSAWFGVAIYGLGVGLVTFCAWACFAAWIIALALTWRRSKK